ncbi:MAG: hypothetical protein CVT72_12005, partial [Alphaproteobacteria bacterium HGW-Alphaproteobacteria-11]
MALHLRCAWLLLGESPLLRLSLALRRLCLLRPPLLFLHLRRALLPLRLLRRWPPLLHLSLALLRLRLLHPPLLFLQLLLALVLLYLLWRRPPLLRLSLTLRR